MDQAMKITLDHAQATYTPQLHKSFDSALEAFFAEECPQLGGARTRHVLVQSIRQMVETYYPNSTHLRAGQLPWTAVHKDARPVGGQPMTQTRLTPVVLDLVPAEEIQARANGVTPRALRQQAVARLFQQAYEQNGVLTNAEVSLLLKISPSTVSHYARQWEANNQSLLPRRGTVHDMGTALTHKREILEKLVFGGKSVETVCRETHHSPEAVLRYTTNFKQVLLCRRKGLKNEDIAFATQLSLRLVEEYQKLIESYGQKHPQWECNGEPWLNDLIDKLEAHGDKNQ
jgi:predicted transcriptional regulator